MKKQYINPTVEIIDIEMDQHLLAGSVPTLGGDLTGSDPILAPELDTDQLIITDELLDVEL